MTQTIQARSLALLSEAGKDLTRNKPVTEDDIKFMRSALDDLKEIYNDLSDLCDLLVRTNNELSIYLKSKGETK